MINKIQTGKIMSVVLAADVVSGSYVLTGKIGGVAVVSGASGDTVNVDTEGVFSDLAKATGETWSFGDALYWDATAGAFTKTSTSNTLAGAAAAAALSADAVGTVRLRQTAG